MSYSRSIWLILVNCYWINHIYNMILVNSYIYWHYLYRFHALSTIIIHWPEEKVITNLIGLKFNVDVMCYQCSVQTWQVLLEFLFLRKRKWWCVWTSNYYRLEWKFSGECELKMIIHCSNCMYGQRFELKRQNLYLIWMTNL